MIDRISAHHYNLLLELVLPFVYFPMKFDQNFKQKKSIHLPDEPRIRVQRSQCISVKGAVSFFVEQFVIWAWM